MKTLPFVRHLRERVTGYAAPRTSPRFYDVRAAQESHPIVPDVLVRVEASMFFEHRVSKDQLETSRAGADGAMSAIRERAVRAIALEAYGPIEQELREILTLLWEDGLQHSEAAARIEAMIPVLRGEVRE